MAYCRLLFSSYFYIPYFGNCKDIHLHINEENIKKLQQGDSLTIAKCITCVENQLEGNLQLLQSITANPNTVVNIFTTGTHTHVRDSWNGTTLTDT